MVFSWPLLVCTVELRSASLHSGPSPYTRPGVDKSTVHTSSTHLKNHTTNNYSSLS